MFALTKRTAVALACAVTALAAAGCGGGGAVQITVTDCAAADIGFTVLPGIVGGPRRWLIQVEATVTCAGVPVEGAEIRVKYGFVDAIKIATDASGKAQAVARSNQDPRPTGTVELTLTGNDGDQTREVSY